MELRSIVTKFKTYCIYDLEFTYLIRDSIDLTF